MEHGENKLVLIPNGLTQTGISSGTLALSDVGDGQVEVKKLLNPDLPEINELSNSRKINSILTMLMKCPKESDLKLSYYTASVLSLDDDLTGSEFDAEYNKWLKAVHAEIPSVKTLLKLLSETPTRVNVPVINTLYWLLVGLRDPRLIQITESQTGTLISCFTTTPELYKPLKAFKVNYATTSRLTQSQVLKKEFGFISVAMCEVFALLFNWADSGLNRCFNDRIQHALDYSVEEKAWPNSDISDSFRTLLVLEYYPHPDIVFVGDVPGNSLSLSLNSPMNEAPNFFCVSSTQSPIKISHLIIFKKVPRTVEFVPSRLVQAVELSTNALLGLIAVSIYIHCFHNLLNRL